MPIYSMLGGALPQSRQVLTDEGRYRSVQEVAIDLGTKEIEGSKVFGNAGVLTKCSRGLWKQERRKRQMNTKSVRLQVVWEPIERTSVGQFWFRGLKTSSLDIAAQYQLGLRGGSDIVVQRLMRALCEPEVAVVAGDRDIVNAEEGHDESRERRRWMWVEEYYVGCFRLRDPVKPKGV
ncbi:hypothetical protein K435DRAFT_802155 [Dendrothele bispora CBS 962.96]|uniref:Uncharacterized protein n=1 Tax=Dendrothele bispora (strain CBS 962.96) TaxID=1314807 RepID=A0A4S8LLW0_DENBC|nr:hypothetical protein K435DRAFT_802155 [Dendrothele bispora CBS 962.96]